MHKQTRAVLDYLAIDDAVYICDDCGEVTEVVEIDDSFDYAGTHCTFGRPGIHRVPVYLGSECCASTYTEQSEDEE